MKEPAKRWHAATSSKVFQTVSVAILPTGSCVTGTVDAAHLTPHKVWRESQLARKGHEESALRLAIEVGLAHVYKRQSLSTLALVGFDAYSWHSIFFASRGGVLA